MHPGNKIIILPKGWITRRINFLLLVAFLTGLLATFTNAQNPGPLKSAGEGISAKKFYSSTIDENNTVWFLTESGIVSFDGVKWTWHNKNPKVSPTGAKSLIYDLASLWLATPTGATVATLPVDEKSDVSTFNPDNSKILSSNVLALAIGKKELKWFGTDKGISAFKNGKWLTNNYEDKYSEGIFQGFPITSLATSISGDSLYIGSLGGGVMRVYRNDVDAVSGASEYVGWGPILMPSDTVYSVHISSDGTQWIGTNRGVARHTGSKTLEGWTVFSTAEGLADDIVQAINSDSRGIMYFGTKNGLSVFDGTKWTNYKIANGLPSNNILTIAIDKKGCVWLGTDNGVTSLMNGKFNSYR